MTIGEKIKNLRKQKGMSLEELGNAVGVSKSTVQKWESGYIANMRRDKISMLSKILGVSPNLFIDDSEPSDKTNVAYVIKDDIYNIPVFESVSAGFGAYADDQVVDFIPTVINNPYDVENLIAIKVKGDSMYPKIEDGDTIIVRRQPIVDNGQIAVVLLDGDEGLVKQIYFGKNWIELVSINPEYKPKKFEDEEIERIRIVGLVKQVIKTF